MSPSPGLSIEGYSLLRKIGEGGFGEVWLSRSETTDAWKALKWISRSSHRHLEQELGALSRYSQAISGKRSHHLLPIEHIRLLEDALIYVMPLSDGFDGLSPHDSAWEPVTLSGLIARHKSHGSWFSLEEIKRIIDGVIQGAGLIGEAGLQHRDIKPENVIFIEGLPALGDFGLATEDMTQVSMRGTPHHAAPSWYLESGGNSDQWGVAILLYQLLTGNSPDKMGRPKYLKPAEGMVLYGEGERSEWNRLQSLVNRATSEVAGERFQGFESFRKAILNRTPPSRSITPTTLKKWAAYTCAGIFILIVGSSLIFKSGEKGASVIANKRPFNPFAPEGSDLQIISAGCEEAKAGSKTLTVTMRSCTDKPIDSSRVTVEATFLEKDNYFTYPGTGAVISRSPSKSHEWKKGEKEVIQYIYQQDKETPPRSFAGYVVAIYYKGELQDWRTDNADNAVLFHPPYFSGSIDSRAPGTNNPSPSDRWDKKQATHDKKM